MKALSNNWLRFVLVYGCCLVMLLPVFGSHAESDEGQGAQYQISIGFQRKLDHERAYAIIRINGQPIRVVLDSGAGTGVALFKHVAEALKLDLKPIADSPGYFTTQARIGINQGRELSDPIPITVVESPPISEFAGVVGWNILKSFVWELDFPNRRQASHDKVPDEAKDWVSFPIDPSGLGNLNILIEEDAKPLSVHLDTGSFGGVSLNPKRWEAWTKASKPQWITLESGFSPASRNGFYVKKRSVADRFSIGKLSLNKVLVEETFLSKRSDGELVDVPVVLGVGVMQRRRVIIDGIGQRVYFGPQVEPADELADINRAQATFLPPRLDGGRLKAHVLEGGVAHRAGLREGDELLMVDGRVADNWPTDESVRPSKFLNQAPGTTVRLYVQREGKQFPIILKLGKSPLDRDEVKDQP